MVRITRFVAFVAALVASMTCPIMGLFSWWFCQEGNWLMAYITSGVSWLMPLVAWVILTVEVRR